MKVLKVLTVLAVLGVVYSYGTLFGRYMTNPSSTPVSQNEPTKNVALEKRIEELKKQIASLEGLVAMNERARASAFANTIRTVEDVDTLREYMLATEPRYALSLLDKRLDRLETQDPNAPLGGEEMEGNFTDGFAPLIYQARVAGAKEVQIEARIDRLLILAMTGRFLSGYEKDLFEREGPAGVEAFLAPKPKARLEVK